MKFKIAFFSICTFLFGFGAFWNIHTGMNIISGYINERVQNTASIFAILNNDPDTNDNQENVSVQTSPTVIEETKDVTLPKSSNAISIIIGGDIMLDRNVRLLGNLYGYDSLFTGITPLFKTADIVVANLEGPITSSPSKTLLADNTLTKSFTFTFDPISAKALSNANISVVSLANNHTDNFGLKGLEETKKILSDANISWFGDPWNTKGSLDKTISINGGKVSFIGYHSFQKGYPNVIARVKELEKDDGFIIVMPHWGDEYTATTTAKMRAMAREFVEAGADAVIGSHSHIIGANEWIGDVPVYYSLGNLLFDQYFSEATMHGELVELHLIVENNKTIFDSLKVIGITNASRKGVELLKEI